VFEKSVDVEAGRDGKVITAGALERRLGPLSMLATKPPKPETVGYQK